MHALNDWEDRHPVFQLFGWCFIGIGLGALSLAIARRPIFQHTRFHGLSLLLSPLITGWLMDRIGKARAARGKPRLPLANLPERGSFCRRLCPHPVVVHPALATRLAPAKLACDLGNVMDQALC